MARLDPQIRRNLIINAAFKLSTMPGLYKFTRADLAADIGCSEALITHYFSDMATLRDEVIRRAVATGAADIIDQARSASAGNV